MVFQISERVQRLDNDKGSMNLSDEFLNLLYQSHSEKVFVFNKKITN